MKTLKLQKRNAPGKLGKMYSLEVHLEVAITQSDSTDVNQNPEQFGSQKTQPMLSSDQPVAVSEDKVMPPQEDETSAVLDEVAHGPTSFSTIKGMSAIESGTGAMDATMTFMGTNSFAVVCGYVEKLMNIGDVAAQVSAANGYQRRV